MKLHSWVVAAAVLLRSNNEMMHYRDIANEVCNSGLSTLGEKGPTPEASLGSIMRRQKCGSDLIFDSCGAGFYRLIDPERIRSNPLVSEALRLLPG